MTFKTWSVSSSCTGHILLTQCCSYQKVLALWAPVKSSGDLLKQCSVIWSNNQPPTLQHDYNCNGWPVQDLKHDLYTQTHRPFLPGEQLRWRIQRRCWFLVSVWVYVAINPLEEILKGELFFSVSSERMQYLLTNLFKLPSYEQ